MGRTDERLGVAARERAGVLPRASFVDNNYSRRMATSVITPRQLQLEGDRFRPYRTIAAWYCWQAVRVLQGEMALPDSTSAGAPTARTATGASGTRVSAPAPQRAASETCVRIRSGVRQSTDQRYASGQCAHVVRVPPRLASAALVLGGPTVAANGIWIVRTQHPDLRRCRTTIFVCPRRVQGSPEPV